MPPRPSRLGRLFGAGLLLRGLVRELKALRLAVEAQNRLLSRLADHVAPVPPAADLAVTGRESGLDYLDSEEAGLVADYVARCERDLGLLPTEEQVVRYLTDQKTTSLQTRLSLREEDLARLGGRTEADAAAERSARRGEF
jgi:hypothetical protein